MILWPGIKNLVIPSRIYLLGVFILAACGSSLGEAPVVGTIAPSPTAVSFITPTGSEPIPVTATLPPTPAELPVVSLITLTPTPPILGAITEPVITEVSSATVGPATPTASPGLISSAPVGLEPTPAGLTVSCADLDAQWGHNWPGVLATLEQLIAAGQSCGSEPLPGKKYAAHFSYAASLESSGDRDSAIRHYQAALEIDSRRLEALDALRRLQALPSPTPPLCLSTASPQSDPAPTGTPDHTQFVTVQGNQLQLNGQIFKIKGINYYPRHAPWYHFLPEADPIEMAAELDLIQAAGFNTLRVFLRYEPLFTCQPEAAIPNEANLTKVDALLQLARERNLKLIMTLNDLPDLTFRPLYTDWAHYDAQTIYLVRRYRNEPTILAWDLRNEGDLDYGARPGDEPRFSQAEVLQWLAHASQLVREHDPYHLLTAGWWGDPTVTGPYVDLLSFHHWTDAAELQNRLSTYRQQSSQPLLLQEVGYPSWSGDPLTQSTAFTSQADSLGRVITLAEAQDLSGWLVWTAFDFNPEPGQPPNIEHFFGLWQMDLTPKPALAVLPLSE